MPSLADHHSNTFVKLLLLGDAKCLAGDTIVKVTRGNSIGKAKTLQQLYHSPEHHLYNHDLDTYLLCDLGSYVGLNVMEQIVFSGVKETLCVTTAWGEIKATSEHKFLAEDGQWLRADCLEEGTNIRHWVPGPGKDIYPARAMIYSIPYHPYANQHNIAGYGNYKRISKARGVLEAEMNGLYLEEFIQILRKDSNKALTLKYIPEGWDVHHKNRDRTDDSISNLEAKPEPEHVAEHSDFRTQTSKATSITPVTSISSAGKTATYDVVMADPYNNFIANGFVVHNSGKTTSLASLVAAGYKLRILDMDNLLDPLKYRILKLCPDRIGNVEYRSLRDQYKPTAAGTMIEGRPKAWIDSIKMLNDWKYTDPDTGEITDLGAPVTWGSDCILVIDSLSRWCDSAYDFHEVMIPKGRTGESDGRAVYGNAQDDVEKQLAMLTNPNLPMNVIVIAHGVYQDMPDGTVMIFPQGVGKKLSPKIPTYFPNYIRYVNKADKRTIQLTSSTMINLANANPDAMPKELSTDQLAEFFAVLREPPAKIGEPSPPRPKAVTLVRR